MGTKKKVIITLSTLLLIGAIIVVSVFAFVSQTFSITNRLSFTAQEGVLGDVVISAKKGETPVSLQNNTFTLEGDLSEYTVPEIDFGTESETILEYAVAITSRSSANIMVELNKVCDTQVANTSDVFAVGNKILNMANNRIVYPGETIIVTTFISLIDTRHSAAIDLGLSFNCSITDANRYVYFDVNGSTTTKPAVQEVGEIVFSSYEGYNMYDVNPDGTGACYYTGDSIASSILQTDVLYAHTSSYTTDKFVFTLDTVTDSYTVTNNGTATTGRLVIPSTYNGRPVTKIAESAFLYNTDITSMYIPDTVTVIESRAFAGYKNLRSIRLSQTLETIGVSAFHSSGVYSINMPDSVVTVLDGAFENCWSLRNVRLSPNITSLTGFAYCGVQEIVVPEGTMKIGNLAFYMCGYSTIEASEKAEGIFGDISGFYANFGSKALINIKLPSTLTSIGVGAFSQCTYLTKITIPSLVTSIGSQAFNGAALTEMTINATIPPTIGEKCFNNIPETCILYVPSASVSSYTSAWGTYFASIQAIPV